MSLDPTRAHEPDTADDDKPVPAAATDTAPDVPVDVDPHASDVDPSSTGASSSPGPAAEHTNDLDTTTTANANGSAHANGDVAPHELGEPPGAEIDFLAADLDDHSLALDPVMEDGAGGDAHEIDMDMDASPVGEDGWPENGSHELKRVKVRVALYCEWSSPLPPRSSD
jgi:hypothetical protein